MTRYLVVAHETATSQQLLGAVRAIATREPDAQFALLVPATPVAHLIFRRAKHDDAEAAARRRVEEARTAFHNGGVNLVDARVGAADPLEAIAAELDRNPGYGGFVISTLPAERSRWLRMRLPDKVRERWGLPVHHVEMPISESAQTMLP